MKKNGRLLWLPMLIFRAGTTARRPRASAACTAPTREIRATALLLHSMTNVGLGNAELVRADFAAMTQAARQPGDIQMAAIFDALRYLMAVFFHTDGEMEPPREEYAIYLPEGTRLYLLYATAQELYLQKNFAQALGVARSALMMAAGRFPRYACI